MIERTPELKAAFDADMRRITESQRQARLNAEAPAMAEALRGIVQFFAAEPNLARDGWMADVDRTACAILARIDGNPKEG